jgi:hypothetical protein
MIKLNQDNRHYFKMEHTHTYISNGTYDLVGFDIEEIVYLNKLTNEVQEIFDFELSLPDYYEKKLNRGVDKKWCGLLQKLT